MADQHNRTRRAFLATTGAAGVAGLAGCSGGKNEVSGKSNGGGNGSQSGTTTGSASGNGGMADKIVFYNAGSLKYDPGTKKNIDRFESDTGIKVEVNEVPWQNLKTSLTTIWRNQGSQVDAFNGPTWWLADFVAANWIEPLGLSKDHMSNFPQNLQDLVTFDGKVYMAPQFGKWGTFLYDKQYLSKQGFDAPPDTWSDVISMGEQLKGGGKAPFSFTWADKDVFMFKQFLWQAGGHLFTDGHKPDFVDKGVEVYDKLLTPLREKDLLPSGYSSMGEGNVGDGFIAGNMAMTESWTPLGKRTIDSKKWDASRLGSAKPPKGPAARTTFQDTNGISVSAFSQRKKAAKKFAEYMTTPKSSETDMYVEGNPAIVMSVYESDKIQQKYPSWLLKDMKYNLKHANSEIYQAQPQVDEYLSNQITPAFLGKKDPKDALKTAQSNITQLYKNLGIL